MVVELKKILVYTQTLNPQTLASITKDCTIIPVATKQALVNTLVKEVDLFCLLIQLDTFNEEWKTILVSIKRSFPMIEVGIIISNTKESIPEGYRLVDACLSEEDILKELRVYINSINLENHRKHHRFEWPLQGFLSFDKKNWEKYKVDSISAGGAYLESDFSPQAGKTGLIRVEFQNFRLDSKCEILDRRQSSSNLPPGFGIRFIYLSDDAKKLIDEIVNDALILTPLNPETEAPVPSIGGEESLPEAFQIL